MSLLAFTSDAYVGVPPTVNAGPMFFALTMLCNVVRRSSAPTSDSLNAPSYGTVDTWVPVYVNLPCRLEIYRQSMIQFKPTGERIEPRTYMYVDASTPLQVEDRIFFLNNSVTGLGQQQEFIVQGALPGVDMIGQPNHHIEYELLVP